MTTKKNILQAIRDQEMDRRDFLKYSGIVLIGIVGFKGLITLLNKPDAPALTVQSQKSARGFGGGKYGV